MFALFLSAGFTYTTEVKAQSVNVNFTLFHNALSSHGRWVNHPRFGQIWINNTAGFRPYSTGGHWAYTDYEWTWVSDYDWGWAPFHYGRWAHEPAYGWYWVPGYQWAPAWVAWRGDKDYYGWAPLSPGINLRVSASVGYIPYDRWVFAPHRYITSPQINRYYVPRTRNVTIIKNTTIVNNVTVRNNVNYNGGPRREDVERVNHTKVQTYTVSNSSRPGRTVVNKKTVNVYRPVINNEKTVINDNDKTVINKNSNNTTVNNNSNNNNNNTSVKNKNTEVNKNNNNKDVNKTTNKQTNKTVNKKPQPQHRPNNKPPQDKKKPGDNKQSNFRQHVQKENVAKAKNFKNRKPEIKQEVAKRKSNGDNNNNR